MSQAPSVTSPSLINPSLQNALGSLEIDLEAELRRYRRSRTAESSSQVYAQNVNPWQSPAEDHLIEVTAQKTDSEGNASVSLPTPERPTSHPPEVERVLEMFRQPDAAVSHPLLNLEDQQTAPEDYLESSEELLKSLDVEPDFPQKQQRRSPLWTPLTIGLVSASVFAAGLLFVVLLFPKTAARVQTAMPLNNAPASVPTLVAETEPKTVNLATQEFVDLSLDNLSVINPTESSAPTAKTPTPQQATTPATTPQGTVAPPPLANPTGRDNLAAALLPPSLRPQPIAQFPLTPQLAATQPSNKPSNEIMVTPDGLKVGYFYVIFRNTTPQSVGKARDLVKDAFVRTFPVGRAVQMAEVSSEVKAQELMKKFNDSKVAVEIYYHQLSPASPR